MAAKPETRKVRFRCFSQHQLRALELGVALLDALDDRRVLGRRAHGVGLLVEAALALAQRLGRDPQLVLVDLRPAGGRGGRAVGA